MAIKGAVIGGALSFIVLILIIGWITNSWNNVKEAEQNLANSAIEMDNSLSNLIDVCNRDIFSDSALVEGRQSCDNTLTEKWYGLCQQYKTELSYSCGKIEEYLKSRGIM